MAIRERASVLYRYSRNSGIVYTPPFSSLGRKQKATTTSVIAASHSYPAMAMPTQLADLPDIPTNCSGEMLAAIREKPTSHQVRPRPAKK